ncbi:hypothetical protein ABPH35_10805 [Streptococcus sp. ZJ93]|uniref:hypothetical protein n=1 Tax=Streptococcus handemini TaxID=3161188 RepID=UPI0032EE284A
MSDVLGGVVFMLVFLMICLGVAIVDQYKLEQERKERELQLIRERELERARMEAVAEAEAVRVAQIRQSLASWTPIQFEAQKPKANRKYGVKYA